MKLRFFPWIIVPFIAVWGLLSILEHHADKVDEEENAAAEDVLALPCAMIPSQNRHYDVSIFRFLAAQYRRNHHDLEFPPPRAYVIGGDEDLLLHLRQDAMETWRITIDPKTPFDIIAFPNAIPFARESGLLVLFMLSVNNSPWHSMELFSEATRPLCQGGVIAFFDEMAPYFMKLAQQRGFERMKWTWYGMELWKKNGGPKQYRSREYGNTLDLSHYDITASA